MALLQKTRTRTRDRNAFSAPETILDHPLTTSGQASNQAREARPHRGALLGAMLSWFSIVFGLCYVALPFGAHALHLNTWMVDSFWFNLPAFIVTTSLTIFAALLAKPSLRLDFRGPRDPVLSATLGGLASWALLHNSTQLLLPFAQMSTTELGSFLLINAVEMSLLGMLLASLTRSHLKAFILGAGFQFVQIGVLTAVWTAAFFL
jgi:hypothetical protein